MKIGIIGAGQIGSTLARKFSLAGHKIKIANSRGPTSLLEVSAESGAVAVTVEDVLRDVDVVILAVPTKAIMGLKARFVDVPDEVVVIDTSNYYPVRDGIIDVLEQGLLESHWVSEQLGRPVVKAFNTISFPSLVTQGGPSNTIGRIALPVAGDNDPAKALVFKLVDAAGFAAVDSGGLDDSWRQQPGTPVYCTDYDESGVRSALLRADKALATKRRDLASEKFSELPTDIDMTEIVDRVRILTRSIFDPEQNSK